MFVCVLLRMCGRFSIYWDVLGWMIEVDGFRMWAYCLWLDFTLDRKLDYGSDMVMGSTICTSVRNRTTKIMNNI